MSSSLRILIVEDEPSMASVLAAKVGMLRAQFPTAKIEIAHTGEVADKLIDSDPPFDAVLLDLSMPDRTMLESVQKYRHYSKRSAIIFVTGRRKWEVEEALDAAGIESVEIVEKGTAIFDGSLFESIIRAIYKHRDRESGERLSRIDGILQKFNAVPNGKGTGANPAT